MQTFTLTRSGQPALRYAIWSVERPKAAVFMTMGYAEHLGRWAHVAERWAAAGFAVAAYDLRGQGESQGRRGHVDRFSDFSDDLLAVLQHLETEHEWKALAPPIWFGHSLGGLISTVTAIDHPSRLSALALQSPYYCLAMAPPAWKVWAGRRVSKVLPTLAQASGVDARHLTRDAARVALMEKDPLRVTTITTRWFTEAEAAQQRVVNEFAKLQMPIYCRAAGADRICDLALTRRLFEEAPRAERILEVAADCYHELHQETDWEQHMDAFAHHFARWANAGERGSIE